MTITNRDILRVFARHARRYAGRMVVVFTALIAAYILEAVTPWFYRSFINTLTGAPTFSTYEVAFRLLIVILALNLANWVTREVNGFVGSDVQPRIMADLERESFAYLLGHSYRFFSDAFAGALVRKVQRLSRGFDLLMDIVQFDLLPATILVTGATVGLGLRNTRLALAFVAWTVIFLAFNYAAARWKYAVDVERASADSAATAALSDSVMNAVTTKLFTGVPYEAERFAAAKEAWRRLSSISWRRGEITGAIQALLMIGIEFGFLAFALRQWEFGEFAVGDFVLIQTYLGLVFQRLWDVGRSFRKITEALSDAREMAEILMLPYAVRDRRGAKPLRVPRGRIEFRDVAFRFPRRPVLDGFSLAIPAKEKIALVGPSGAGKSTIVKLLFRFYDIHSGSIRIDGQDIARVTQDSLRDALALVPQEPILFHRTLLENIRYGRRDATDAEVIVAAEQAHCHEFISAFPAGYETFVGERGVKLSGGERQRVAIARAILRDAPILVLDEATASLDSESERYIQDALRALMEDKTVIVIAHRLSTIQACDRIAVIEGGRVTATGTHHELLAAGGTYKRLWDIQAGGFIA